MIIIFLAFVSILSVSCGNGGIGSKNTNSWTAPSLYILRDANGESSTVLKNRDALQMNDYLYFSENKSSDVKTSELNRNTGFSIQSSTSCITSGKTFFTSETFAKNSVRIKEILPVDALLSRDATSTSCKIKITLINTAGSTKTYPLDEKLIEFKQFNEDFKITHSLGASDLSSAVIPNVKLNDQVNLVCQSLTYQLTYSQAEPLNVSQVLPDANLKYKDILRTEYQPQQLCRITIRNNNIKTLSNQFEIHFTKLTPKLAYQLNPGKNGNIAIAYNIQLSNPYIYPISFAVNKSALRITFAHTYYKPGGKESDGYDKTNFYEADISLGHSGNDKYFERENAYIIHLLPNESIALQGYKDVGKCSSNSCTNSRATASNIPIYHLEYNFRDVEEIKNSATVIMLNQIEAN